MMAERAHDGAGANWSAEESGRCLGERVVVPKAKVSGSAVAGPRNDPNDDCDTCCRCFDAAEADVRDAVDHTKITTGAGVMLMGGLLVARRVV
jgi:hypothetical protein